MIGTPKECNKIPKHLTEEEQKRTREEFGEVKERDRKRIRCFERGWGHFWEGEKSPGYFIGCSHFPFTDVCVVRGVDPVCFFFFLFCFLFFVFCFLYVYVFFLF